MKYKRSDVSKDNRGFTLIELAIVLIIVPLLMGGMFMTLSAQIDQRDYSQTRNQLKDFGEALIGFAASHNAALGGPYLPCPDTDGDGYENRNIVTGACTSLEGFLPWSDLGVANQDAWSNRFRYRVTQSFANSQVGFSLSSLGTLRVCEQQTCASTVATSLPVVIVSHGKNGFSATNSAGGNNSPASSPDEIENANDDNNFVYHTPTPPGASEFDDLVSWISPYVLFNRMIAAGRLP